MPRRNRPAARGRRAGAEPAAPVPVPGGAQRRESWGAEQFLVRSVPAAAAQKSYRCPGCDHEVRAGVAHVVAWPEHEPDAGGRRHWHASCWAARERRAPTRRR